MATKKGAAKKSAPKKNPKTSAKPPVKRRGVVILPKQENKPKKIRKTITLHGEERLFVYDPEKLNPDSELPDFLQVLVNAKADKLALEIVQNREQKQVTRPWTTEETAEAMIGHLENHDTDDQVLILDFVLRNRKDNFVTNRELAENAKANVETEFRIKLQNADDQLSHNASVLRDFNRMIKGEK